MADARALDAINRIERALARIEAAATRPAAPVQDSADYRRLIGAHETLRREVAGVIGEIDALVGSEKAS